MVITVDLSFQAAGTIDKLSIPKNHQPSSNPICLRMNNNELKTLEGIGTLIKTLGTCCWLDASCNQIEVLEFAEQIGPSLKVLYLHGNKLNNLEKTIAFLTKFPNLQAVTLNGNPVETAPLITSSTYRMRILAAIPQLRSLDHVTFTMDERDQANRWFNK